MHPHGFQRVCTARRVEPAPRSEERADKPLICGQQTDEQPASRRQRTDIRSGSAAHWITTPPCRRSNASITRSRSAARSAWQAVAARGAARTTRRLPPGSKPRYPRARCRSRRRTVFLTTAEPTALLTTNPTRAASELSGRTSRCPDTSGRPALLPPRVASANSALRRILAAAGSMIRSRPATSDADARATLPAPGREDRAASPGAHAQAEAMSLRPAAVVRLKSTLTHLELQVRRVCIKTAIKTSGITTCRYYEDQASQRFTCKAQAAALSLADFNNRQPRTHPCDRPHLYQAAIQLHRSTRTSSSYAPGRWRVKPSSGNMLGPAPATNHSLEDPVPATKEVPVRCQIPWALTWTDRPIRLDHRSFPNGPLTPALGCG